MKERRQAGGSSKYNFHSSVRATVVTVALTCGGEGAAGEGRVARQSRAEPGGRGEGLARENLGHEKQ